MTKKNPFPGVKRLVDRHGKTRWRLRRTVKGHKIDCLLPSPYGSLEFRAAYDAAHNAAPVETRAEHGTVAWLIEEYRRSVSFADLSMSRKKTLVSQLDWIRKQAGQYQFARLEVRHIEALMSRKKGPSAANADKKNMSALYNFADKKLKYTGQIPLDLPTSAKKTRAGITPGPTRK